MAGKNLPHRRLPPEGHGSLARATGNLVVPLGHEPTAMRTTDTAAIDHGTSGAVSALDRRGGDVWTSANSYFGLFRQATRSHADRAQLANLVRHRGLAVDHRFTKVYQ